MKTGTPVRIDRRSVHFEDMERQEGENDFHHFSFMGEGRRLEQLPCWTCNTNAEAHATLMAAISESPLYNGQIQSTGLHTAGPLPRLSMRNCMAVASVTRPICPPSASISRTI